MGVRAVDTQRSQCMQSPQSELKDRSVDRETQDASYGLGALP
jgi:hypothetical protein